MGNCWGPLGASSGHLAANHGLSQRAGHDLESFGGVLGPSWAVMGLSSGHLGARFGRLGALVDWLQAVWGQFGTMFGASWAVSDARKTGEPIIQQSYEFFGPSSCVWYVSGAAWGFRGAVWPPSRPLWPRWLDAARTSRSPGSPEGPSARASMGSMGPRVWRVRLGGIFGRPEDRRIEYPKTQQNSKNINNCRGFTVGPANPERRI